MRGFDTAGASQIVDTSADGSFALWGFAGTQRVQLSVLHDRLRCEPKAVPVGARPHEGHRGVRAWPGSTAVGRRCRRAAHRLSLCCNGFGQGAQDRGERAADRAYLRREIGT